MTSPDTPAAPHVLVIDDDPIWCTCVERILANAGFTSTSVNSARAGLAEVRRRDADVVICDWDMPEMSGIDMLTVMRSEPQLRVIPVILATAYASTERREQAFDAGAVDFIAKPPVAHVIVRSVARAMLFASPPPVAAVNAPVAES